MRIGMSWKVTLGFISAVCILLAMAVLSYQRTTELAEAGKWVSHSNEILTELEGTVSDVTEAEASVRGFLLTGGNAYLTTWRNGAGDVPKRLQRLHQLTADNPKQQARLADLETAIQQKLDWAAQMVSVYKREQPQAALAQMRSGQGGLLMDQVRQTASSMANEEKTLLRARMHEAEARTRRATASLRVLAVTILLVLGLAYYHVKQEMHALAKVQFDLAQSQAQLKEALQREKEISREDPLTNVANRRAFYEALESESKRARRYSRPLSVAYLDIDSFKGVNDSFGHAIGDALLVNVATILRTNSRAGCCIARFGGDEFALMIPDVPATEVDLSLRRLRNLLLEDMGKNGWPVTFSIGAVVFPRPPNSVEEMVRAADNQMYAVKNKSKNGLSVITADESGSLPPLPAEQAPSRAPELTKVPTR